MAQRKSTLQIRYENLHEKVCIPKLNSRENNTKYRDLVNEITKQGNKEDVKEIVKMTELFVNVLEKNKKDIYCNPKRCRNLPYIKNKKDTRDFIPTSYHILQDYDLFYIKSDVSREILKKITNIRDFAKWEKYADLLITNKGETFEESMKSKYYQDCVETIQRVILLRKFDLDYCTEPGETTERENHNKFIDRLNSLKNKWEGRTDLINIEQNISESVTSNDSNNSTGPSGTTSGSAPDQTNTNQGEGIKLTFAEMLKRR